MENKTVIMQYILKMQEIFLLPKYMKWNLGFFYVQLHTWTQFLRLNESSLLYSAGFQQNTVQWQ